MQYSVLLPIVQVGTVVVLRKDSWPFEDEKPDRKQNEQWLGDKQRDAQELEGGKELRPAIPEGN